jgi:hypothetical protein
LFVTVATVTRSALDRSRLPPPDVFFRQNVDKYQRAGGKARGRCPFHKPSNPRSFSRPFSINLSSGLWHCFVCEAGGDVIDFVRLRDGCNFVNAAKKLGVWRSMSPQETEAFDRARRAKAEKQQARLNAFYDEVQRLRDELATFKRLHRRAIRTGNPFLLELAADAIASVAIDYVLTKAEFQEKPCRVTAK